MDLYIPHDRAAHLIGWSDADLRTLRRTLRPSIRIGRIKKGGQGRLKDHLQLDDLLRFMNQVTGGLHYSTAYKLAFAAAPLANGDMTNERR